MQSDENKTIRFICYQSCIAILICITGLYFGLRNMDFLVGGLILAFVSHCLNVYLIVQDIMNKHV